MTDALSLEPPPGSAQHQISVLIVVPTRNSGRVLARCLESIRAQSYPCSVVVVDNFSTDDTGQIAESKADLVIVEGPERSRQRNVGAKAEESHVVGFVDSDMVLGRGVVDEVVERVRAGAGAVIVPERTVGEGYWSRVRAFERSFYVGEDSVEAARFFRRDIFIATGGFDEGLDAGEDWDLTIRTRALTSIARVDCLIDHDEGRVRYIDACRKKGSYAAGIRKFVAKQGMAGFAAWRRPYFRAPWRLLIPSPGLGVGLIALKAGESWCVAKELAVHRLGRSRRSSS